MTHFGNGIDEGAYVSTGELPERSVKGQKVAKFLSARLGMDLLISAPALPRQQP